MNAQSITGDSNHTAAISAGVTYSEPLVPKYDSG